MKMNEKIKEFEEQCWEPRKYGPHWFNSDKFAELIILECARVDSEQNNCDHIDGVTYNQTIIEHFGLKI